MKKIYVTTSWDDGHKLDLKLGELLKKYRLTGTFYISLKNHEFHKSELLSSQEIKDLSKNYEIGAHTLTHPDLTKISVLQAKKEINQSRLYLEKIINKKINSFCYPSGKFNPVIKKLIKKSGFKLARTTKRFMTDLDFDSFLLPTTVHAYTHLQDLFNVPVMISYKSIKWSVLAIKLFNKILRSRGFFHLWGHSWEIEKYHDWDQLEEVFKLISSGKDIEYLSNFDLVQSIYGR